LSKFGVNPALASGPFITTANDIIGLAVYFGVAHLLYH
jgi:magnesium transporter